MPNLSPIFNRSKIFPCIPGGKHPATQKGWRDASDNPEQIEIWERVNPHFNWAVATGPSGLFVVDVDPEGLDAWEAMQAADPELRAAVVRSYTVRTPRGGFHHYWRGQGPSTASRIAPGIDTRGGIVGDDGQVKSGGYVVLPGSRTAAGAYTEAGGVLEPMPPVIAAIVPDKVSGTVHGLERTPDLDQPRNEQWALDLLGNYVREGRVSIEGKGGNNTAFQVAASILDKAISPARCFELMAEHWNPHCSPPWDDWELETVVANAARYGEDTGKGAKGFQDNASVFEKFAGAEFAEEKPHAPSRRDRVKWIDDYAASVQDPVWLLPGILPAHGTGMLYGASGSYKSFLALDMASCLAHGHAGQWGAAPVANDVLYFAGEAPIGTAKQRRPAWLEWQGVTSPHRLAIFPRVPFMGDSDGWAGVKLDIEEMGMKPRLIILDTLTRLLTGFDENSTKDATMATGFMEDLARFYECFVLAIHHTGKDESRGARGSSAFGANLDTVLMTKKRKGGTEFQVKKHKDADAPDSSIFFKAVDMGKSLVLEKTDSLETEEEPGRGTSKISWSDPDEILKRLTRNGGSMSNPLLAQEIAGDLGIDKAKVNAELRKRQDLNWLRDPANSHQWRIPGEQEFDL